MNAIIGRHLLLIKLPNLSSVATSTSAPLAALLAAGAVMTVAGPAGAPGVLPKPPPLDPNAPAPELELPPKPPDGAGEPKPPDVEPNPELGAPNAEAPLDDEPKPLLAPPKPDAGGVSNEVPGAVPALTAATADALGAPSSPNNV